MLLVADTSPLITLFLLDKFDLLAVLFPNFVLPQAVWAELNKHNEIRSHKEELLKCSERVRQIKNFYSLSGIDKGETEAIILYKELNADILLIDDKRARQTAESMDIQCVGTLAVLYKAKQRKLIEELRPIFLQLNKMKRYYAVNYLNYFLSMANELEI